MAKFSKLLNPETIYIHPGQNAIVLKRLIFDQTLDAGKIDAFIENHFPGKINRDGNQVNGVSVTKDEIIITLAQPLSETEVNTIISSLENASL